MQRNHIELMGFLGGDAEVQTTPTGKTVLKLRMATTEYWTDDQGERQSATQWHNVVMWSPGDWLIDGSLAKGACVWVEGALKYRTYDNRDGVKVTVAEIAARKITAIPLERRSQARDEDAPRQARSQGARQGNGAAAAAPPPAQRQASKPAASVAAAFGSEQEDYEDDDDVPF